MSCERVKFSCRGASATLVCWDNGVNVLADVYSSYPREGNGSALMEQVIEYADTHQIDIWLIVRAYRHPDGEMDNRRLEAFYSKFGFERIPDIPLPVEMIRKSQKTQPL